MNIFEEFKISFIKPQFYSRLRGESIPKILRFQVITTILAILYSMLLQFFIGAFTGKILVYVDYYKTLGSLSILVAIIYMWLGVLTSSLVIAIVYYIINLFKRVDHLNFKDLFNYASHVLIVCVIFAPFFGPLVILFAIGYYLMALRFEKVTV